jgi:hypothetical protein
MTIDVAHLAPYAWVIAAVLVFIVVFLVIRFFWQHILKYLLQGCLVIVGIFILLEVLHYLKVF